MKLKKLTAKLKQLVSHKPVKKPKKEKVVIKDAIPEKTTIPLMSPTKINKNPKGAGRKRKNEKLYVNPEELSKLILEYYKTNVITNELAEMLSKICNRLAFSPNFINYCVDEETEIYTTRGWVKHNELNAHDQTMSFDLADGQIKWSPILDIYKNKYNGKMFHLTGPGFDALVTPKHKFVVIKNKKFVLKPVDDLKITDKIIISGKQKKDDIKILPVKEIDLHGATQGLKKPLKIKNKPTIDYKGIVWCPQTIYGTFVCQRNGYVYVTGNSYREEMIGDAIVKCFQALQNKNFDPKKGNPFSYFTMISCHAFFNRIKKEKLEHKTITDYQKEVYDGLVSSNLISTQATNTTNEEEE
jgi:hypothetical protein